MNPIVERLKGSLESNDPAFQEKGKLVFSASDTVIEAGAELERAEAQADLLARAYSNVSKQLTDIQERLIPAKAADDHTQFMRVAEGQAFDVSLMTAKPLQARHDAILEFTHKLLTVFQPATAENVTLARIRHLEASSRYHAATADFLLMLTAAQVSEAGLLDKSAVLDPSRGITGEHRAEAARTAGEAERMGRATHKV